MHIKKKDFDLTKILKKKKNYLNDTYFFYFQKV